MTRRWTPLQLPSHAAGAYQVHRDSFEEYDCQKRTWQLLEYEDSHAVKHPKAEWIKPTGR